MRVLAGLGRYIGALAVTVWVGGPLVWLAFTSLRIPLRVFQYPPTLQGPFTTQNYTYVLQHLQLMSYLQNSVLVDGFATVFALFLGLAASFGIAQMARRQAYATQWMVVVARMVPAVALIVPVYFVFDKLGLLNTRIGLGLMYTATSLPLAVWMLGAYLRQVPDEVLQAARVDGAGPVRTLVSILAPMMVPGLIAVGVLTFLANWNEFLLAVTLTSSVQSATLPVALVQLNQEYGVEWQFLSAAVMVSIAIPVVIGALTQRRLVSGITAGAVK